MPLGLFVTGVFARILTPDDLGRYSILCQAAVVGALLGNRGIEHALLPGISRRLARDGESEAVDFIRANLSGVVATLLLLGGGAALWFITGWSSWAEASSTQALILGTAVAVWILATGVQRYLFEAFRGLGHIPAAVLFGGQNHIGGVLSAGVLAACLGVWVAVQPAASLTTAILLSASTVVLGSVAGAFLLRARVSAPATGSTTLSRSVTNPLLVNNVTQYLGRRADIWVGALVLDDAALGLYATVALVPLLLNLPLNAVNVSLTSLVGELLAEDAVDEVRSLVGRAGGWAVLAGVPVAVFLLLFGDWVLGVAFGPFFEAGHLVLVVLCCAQVASLCVASSGWVLLMAGFERDLMWTSLLGAVLTVVSAWALASVYGTLGLAIGASLGMTVQQFGKLIMARVRLGRWFGAQPFRAIASL